MSLQPVGRRNQALICIAIIEVVRDKQENFCGDPVYGRERVLDGPDQAEDFQCIPFESVHLKLTNVSRCARICSLCAALLHLELIHGIDTPAGITVEHFDTQT